MFFAKLYSHISRSRLNCLLGVLTSASIFMCSANELEAQERGMQDAQEAKKLVDETNEYEEQKRKELEKKITEQHKKTIEALTKLASKYHDRGEKQEAREILKAVRRLEAKLEGLEGEEVKPAPAPESKIFEYGKRYLFNNDKIQGRITFLEDGKVNVIFKLADDARNVTWDFEEKDDHIYIKDAGDLGKIYISEVPKSDKRSIMIRWGGKLRHEVLTASF